MNIILPFLTFVDGNLVQHRIRAREVDILEQAGAEDGTLRYRALVGVEITGDVHEHALARGDVACGGEQGQGRCVLPCCCFVFFVF